MVWARDPTCREFGLVANASSIFAWIALQSLARFSAATHCFTGRVSLLGRTRASSSIFVCSILPASRAQAATEGCNRAFRRP